MVSAGMPLMICNQLGQTAMHIAALWGHVEALEAMIELGADVDCQNVAGTTPLHFAAAAKDNIPEAVRTLIRAGADPDIADSSDRLPWELAQTDDAAVLRLLGAPDPRLFEHCEAGDAAAVTSALDTGCRTAARRGHDGATLFHIAAAADNVDMLRLLLGRPDVSAQTLDTLRDLEGWLPLHAAAKENSCAAIEVLIEGGSNPDVRTYSRSEYAGGSWVSGGQTLTHEDKAALHIAVEEGAEDAVETLLAKGADADAKDFNGETALLQAITMAEQDLVKTLLAHGADPNCGCKDHASPLHAAASSGQAGVVKALVAAGADPNTPDDDGWTPTLLATRRGKAAIVKLLLEAGANVNAQVSSTGATALHVAAKSRKKDIVEALLAAGADKGLLNKDGQRASEVCEDETLRQLLAE